MKGPSKTTDMFGKRPMRGTSETVTRTPKNSTNGHVGNGESMASAFPGKTAKQPSGPGRAHKI